MGGASAAILEFRPWEVWQGVPCRGRGPPGDSRRRRRTASRGPFSAEMPRRSTAYPSSGIPCARPDAGSATAARSCRCARGQIVLTGDIGAEIDHIASDFQPRSAARSVPHHGSLTSSSSDSSRPSLHASLSSAWDAAIGSVTRSGSCGVRGSARGGIRTDRDGAVTVDTDGTSVNVRTFMGGNAPFSQGLLIRKHEGHEEGLRRVKVPKVLGVLRLFQTISNRW
jgi:hypothetical protein